MWHHYVENSISIKKHVLKLAYCQPTPERHVYLKKKNHLHYHCVQMKIMKVLFRIGSNFLPSDIILFFFVDYQLFTVDQFKVLTG